MKFNIGDRVRRLPEYGVMGGREGIVVGYNTSEDIVSVDFGERGYRNWGNFSHRLELVSRNLNAQIASILQEAGCV